MGPNLWNLSPQREGSFTRRRWHIKWVPAQKSLHGNTSTGRRKTCFPHVACCWDLALNGIDLCKSSRLKDEAREASGWGRRHFRLPVGNATSLGAGGTMEEGPRGAAAAGAAAEPPSASPSESHQAVQPGLAHLWALPFSKRAASPLMSRGLGSALFPAPNPKPGTRNSCTINTDCENRSIH